VTFGSLFSGIGAIDLGLVRCGLKPLFQVESDAYCQLVLARHWPRVKRFSDVRDFTSKSTKHRPDMLCGGFPCQPVSQAGQRKGADDERWLWPEFDRIIREFRPGFVLLENVPALLGADHGKLFGGVLRDLASSGYHAQWGVLSASQFGLPHLRKRVFVLAYANGQRWTTILDKTRIITQPQAISSVACRTWFWRPGDTSSGRSRLLPPASFLRSRDEPPCPLDRDRIKAVGNAVVPDCVIHIVTNLRRVIDG